MKVVGEHWTIHADLDISSLTDEPWDAELISSMLGISPTKSWKKGDQTPNGAIWNRNAWKLTSDTDSVNPADHIQNILEKTSHIPPENLPFLRKFEVILQLGISSHGDCYPPLTISKEMLSGLVKINAAIDIDIY